MRIALIDSQANQPGKLKNALKQNDVEVSSWPDNTNLHDFIENSQADVLVVDINCTSYKTIEQLSQLTRKNPKPIIVVTESDDIGLMEEAAKAGITIYVATELPPALLQSLINVGITHFNSQRTLINERNKAQSELHENKLVAHAKALLMKHAKMSENKAYEHIRLKAMRHRITKTKVASDIVALVEQQSQAH